MSLTKNQIEEIYQRNFITPSDINQHLPKLREYADKCKHITELGVRGCVSLSAFLASEALKVVAVDIMNVSVPDCDKLEFICANDLEVVIEKTDFLFIDSLHTYDHLKAELNLHAKNVNKYIGFHDTTMFGKNGEDGGKGLSQAISEFMVENPEWNLEYATNINNGLTILTK